MKFGLMFFAASEDSLGSDKYRVVVESARFADEAGFSSIWVPERHFTTLGGLYPNPAVLHAALAMCTTQIGLRAGSVVAPLHHIPRIAEEWSVVDNLSQGRVGLSFASGWNPNDFVLAPERYGNRHEYLFDAIRSVQSLWRGEAFSGMNGTGEVASVTTFPRPVQRELPVWVTVAGNPKHFEKAGSSGANLLTHLLDQDEEGLASRIALYRNARADAGFDPESGEVSLMLHTLVGTEAGRVREQARKPYCDYIKANVGLFKGLAQSRGHAVDLASMSAADLDEFVDFLYDRFAVSRGLIGTPESCALLVSRLEKVGVTELACLLDFGPDPDLILENLPNLARLRDLGQVTSLSGEACSSPVAHPEFDPGMIRQRCTQELSGAEFRIILERHGISVSGEFEPGTVIWRCEGEALGRLSLESRDSSYHVHPAALDACSRVLVAAWPGLERAEGKTYVPTGCADCSVYAPLTDVVWAHSVMTEVPDERASSASGDVRVYSDAGQLLVEINGVRLVSIEPEITPARTRGLLYHRVWRDVKWGPATSPDAEGRWLLIADEGGVSNELTGLIQAHGGQCVAGLDVSSLRGVVYLRGLDAAVDDVGETGAMKRQVERALRGGLELVQEFGETPVWFVTAGAAAGPELAGLVNVAQAPLWGLGRALAVERPGGLGGLVDLEPGSLPREAAEQLLELLTAERGEDMVAVRGGVRFVPRLRLATAFTKDANAVSLNSGDTVLVTGGLGGIGLRVAQWLVSRGARHLILCSRRAPTKHAVSRLESLRASGVDVVALQVDVADSEALTQQVREATMNRPDVSAVFHLAGTLDDGQLADQTWERFAGVFDAKVEGAWNLHRLTCDTRVKYFVLFSSVASLVPAPGQSNYAAANGFLDSLAYYRREQGLTALVVNWGPWADVGHVTTDYGRRAHQQLAALGIGAISPDEGMSVLETLLEEDWTQAAAVSVDWLKLFGADAGAARLGLLADLREAAKDHEPEEGCQPSEMVDELLALPEDERRAHLMGYLSGVVVTALKLRVDGPIDARQPLFEIGLDSMIALELKGRLEQALGVKLKATLLLVHPTLEALSDYLLTEIVGVVHPSPGPELPRMERLSEQELAQLLVREIDKGHGD